MTIHHQFNDSSDFADRGAEDLAGGMKLHNLQALIDDINDARKQAQPGGFPDWMQKFNQTATGLNSTTKIVDVDDTGKNLIVADCNTHRGFVISPLGAPLKMLSEDEVAARVPQHMVKVSDLARGDGKFSFLMPPGIDTTGSGAFKVKGDRDEKVVNRDGTITHNVSGKLSNKDWAMNSHAYESNSDSAFTGNYTTTSDGRLLNSHIAYQGNHSMQPIFGGVMRDYPNMPGNPNTPFREAGKAIWSPYVDTVYSKTSGDYLTMIDLDKTTVGFGTTKAFETRFSGDGKTQTHEISHPGVEMTGATNSYRFHDHESRIKSPLKRDEAGNVIEVDYQRSVHIGHNKAIIVRDRLENPIAVTEDDGTQWNKISDGRWNKTTAGQTSTFVGQVFVEDCGNIVFVDDKTVTVAPIDSYVQRQVVNNQGQVIAQDMGPVHLDYQYGQTGKLQSIKTVVDTPNEKSTSIDNHPLGGPIAIPISFFEFKSEYQ